MEIKIEIGKYYEFRRSFGKIVRGKLIEWNGPDKRVVFSELNKRGLLALDKLEKSELESFKEIDPDT